MIYDNTDEVTEELFESVLNRYQIGLETSMRNSDFIFDCVHLLYCKCHRTNPSRSGLYIDFSDWINNKKTTINPINKKDNDKTGKSPERISKIKPFTDKHN